MTVTISLAPDEEKKLARLAAANGTNLSEFVQSIIRKELDAPLSISQAAEPFARAVDASGVTEAEFDSILEQARAEARAQRRDREST